MITKEKTPTAPARLYRVEIQKRKVLEILVDGLPHDEIRAAAKGRLNRISFADFHRSRAIVSRGNAK